MFHEANLFPMKTFIPYIALFLTFVLFGCDSSLTEPDTVEPDATAMAQRKSHLPALNSSQYVSKQCDNPGKWFGESDGSTHQGWPVKSLWNPFESHTGIFDQNLYIAGVCKIDNGCSVVDPTDPGNVRTANTAYNDLDECVTIGGEDYVAQYQVNAFSASGIFTCSRQAPAPGAPTLCPGGCSNGACICAPGNEDWPGCISCENGTSNDPACDGELDISSNITGPGSGVTGQSYTWNVNASGGTAPLTHVWATSTNGSTFTNIGGNGPSYTGQMPSGHFYLRVHTISSSGMRDGYAYKTIYNSQGY